MQRWGRGQETPGEDPTINGEYAEAFVSGMQGDERTNGYLKVSACLKHYAACEFSPSFPPFASQLFIVSMDLFSLTESVAASQIA